MKIHHVALTVNNLEESKDFYSKLFNFEEVRRFERPDLGGKAIFMKCDNTMLELWEFSNSQPFQNEGLQRKGIRHIAFEVKNMDEFIKKVPGSILQGKINQGASGARFVFLKDPSGIDLELYESN